ncbi:P-loop containing nucleoside triphosphate hydrolase protein [Gautieria morchelliformis]|nr:P-loop containing nucleoside triphosphate hydrolase protein [Gautieria morchelliformis]
MSDKDAKSSKAPVEPPFDPKGGRITHTRIGVWDLYEKSEDQIRPWLSWPSFQIVDELLTSLPHVLKAFKTLATLRPKIVIVYFITRLITSLLPAATLYYSGQLLQVVQTSIDSRSVDPALLLRVFGYKCACGIAQYLTQLISNWAVTLLSESMRSHYSEHILQAHIRLDVPSYDDPSVRGQLISSREDRNVAWDAINISTIIGSTLLRLISQFTVLITVLRGHPDSMLLASLSFADPILDFVRQRTSYLGGTWAATCRSQDFLRMEGFRKLAETAEHRKELVAGNLQNYIVSEFKAARDRIGIDSDMSFHLAHRYLYQGRHAFSLFSFLRQPMQELPQLVFTIRAMQSPRSIPVSLASLTLIKQTVADFEQPLLYLLYRTSSLSETLRSLRRLYEMSNLKNQVVDGTEPYPENRQTLQTGISVEFRHVSYKYPGSEKYALRNVSFKIGAGQLCVIVGSNGSGKSTVLKLLTRLYDPNEGIILVDGRDIRNLKLEDLRSCISALFQDYTHFPLSIKENIGMGDPKNARDEDRIRQAAALGGATEFIEELAEGFDTILSRPVRDIYSGLPEGTTSLFGRKVNYSGLKSRTGYTQEFKLSGGQMQRLAVSRTFMRSLGDDYDVGLLLFDEPSASLDPGAEHDLFERLRQLRGNKTMIFSSHRYGQLTRHADLILYMGDSTVLELGKHEDLVKRGGGYSKMYHIQASQFQ